MYYLHFIKHYLTSHSRHGTHSPFVYELAEKVIYKTIEVYPIENEDQISISTGKKTLIKILNHLNITTISTLTSKINSRQSAIILRSPETTPQQIKEQLAKDNIIVIENIYHNKKNIKSWKTVIEDESVTVGIDLFHFGILLKREGQFKENFILRHPFWIK